jgi:hypothetical protein
MATLSGIGGVCNTNPHARPYSDSPPRKRGAKTRRY